MKTKNTSRTMKYIKAIGGALKLQNSQRRDLSTKTRAAIELAVLLVAGPPGPNQRVILDPELDDVVDDVEACIKDRLKRLPPEATREGA